MPQPDGQLRRVTIGCAALTGALCLILAVPLPYLLDEGHRVAAAVRATYPEMCHEWRDTLLVSPSPLGWFTTWDVTCASGFSGGRGRLLTVNVLTCRARAPVTWARGWRSLLAALAGDGDKLTICP